MARHELLHEPVPGASALGELAYGYPLQDLKPDPVATFGGFEFTYGSSLAGASQAFQQLAAELTSGEVSCDAQTRVEPGRLYTFTHANPTVRHYLFSAFINRIQAARPELYDAIAYVEALNATKMPQYLKHPIIILEGLFDDLETTDLDPEPNVRARTSLGYFTGFLDFVRYDRPILVVSSRLSFGEEVVPEVDRLDPGGLAAPLLRTLLGNGADLSLPPPIPLLRKVPTTVSEIAKAKAEPVPGQTAS
ncbi:MAG TPA: hypothetical protein VLG37_01150 [Candidatus Saccharimonadales bacterium]|nr:hypothetical protein [Candidatus Saccharimonadales bacterium]